MTQAPPTPTTGLRQKLLFLYLANSALGSAVVGWSSYDGTTTEGPDRDSPEPPYDSALDAMREGWRVIQVSPLQAQPPGQEYELDYLPFEVILEKLEEASA